MVSVSTSPESEQVMGRPIPSGFALQCSVDFEGYSYLPNNIFVSINIARKKIVYRGELREFKLAGINLEKAFLNLELTDTRKEIEVGV